MSTEQIGGQRHFEWSMKTVLLIAVEIYFR